jgi:hypothetical protein
VFMKLNGSFGVLKPDDVQRKLVYSVYFYEQLVIVYELLNSLTQ